MSGLLPDTDGTGRRLRSGDVFLDHGRAGGPKGLYTLLGTKLTTAQALSEYAASRIWPGRPVSACSSAHGIFEPNSAAGVAPEEPAHGG
jgi:hypothetical protein